MTREWKVGDKVQLEGVVTNIDSDDDVLMTLDGGNDETLILHDEMANATLIEPKREPVENKVLDLSKPIRIKVSPHVEVREVFGPSSRGFCLVDRTDGIIDVRLTEELENIPEPNRTMTRDVVMVEGISSLVWDGVADGHKIIARGTITLTEGDGV